MTRSNDVIHRVLVQCVVAVVAVALAALMVVAIGVSPGSAAS
ncbi:MAG: hypothetical protein JWR83_1378, partial [Aeromicrobium sp.]|nr:hypothetical protein [Aeromicrobium sp.]